MLDHSVLSRQLPKSKSTIRENITIQITKLRDKTIIMNQKIKRKETRKKNRTKRKKGKDKNIRGKR